MYVDDKRRNRNARRSVRLLLEAYADLMNTTPYDKITVTALVNRAGLNRSTFYAHFDSPEDVRALLEQRLVEDVREVVGGLDKKGLMVDPSPLLSIVASRIMENREYVRFMFERNGASTFWLDGVKETMIEKLLEDIDDKYLPKYDELKMNLRFFFGGYMAVCRDCMNGKITASIESLTAPLAKTISGALAEVCKDIQ